MSQVGTINAPEPRLLTVQVWDKSLVKAVEKAIQDSGLGLNPQSDGQLVRVPIPALTEERRIELSKIASKYAEDSRVAVRNVRRHFMDELKKMKKTVKFPKIFIMIRGRKFKLLLMDLSKKLTSFSKIKKKKLCRFNDVNCPHQT